MPDREKVIKGLGICFCSPSKCEDCPYHDVPDEQSCNDTLCLDALALLKEQEEAVESIPYHRSDGTIFNYEMNIKELCELAHEKQVLIELRIEPTGYGGENTTFTVQPWEKYEPFCPHGTPIVYVKGKEEGR